MYRLAGSHDPDSMRAVGERVYAQMAAAGYGAVGEFHYVVHQPDGTPYAEPNAMAIALAEAAVACGLEIVLLPAAYNRGGPRAPGPIRASCDSATPTCRSFLERVDALRAWASGARRVSGRGRGAQRPRRTRRLDRGDRRQYAEREGLVRHVHACEQRRELEECEAEHGCSPIELLARTGFLGPRTSVVHAIHVTDRDVELLAESELDRGHLPDDRGQPRRRRTCRGCATATPACGWRSAPTRRSGSTRSRSCARWRRWPGASARRATRCWPPPTATSGGRRSANGRASASGLDERREHGDDRARPRSSRAGRRRRAGSAARARHLRVGRGGAPAWTCGRPMTRRALARRADIDLDSFARAAWEGEDVVDDRRRRWREVARRREQLLAFVAPSPGAQAVRGQRACRRRFGPVDDRSRAARLRARAARRHLVRRAAAACGSCAGSCSPVWRTSSRDTRACRAELVEAVAAWLDGRPLPPVPRYGNGGSGEIQALGWLFDASRPSSTLGSRSGWR